MLLTVRTILSNSFVLYCVSKDKVQSLHSLQELNKTGKHSNISSSFFILFYCSSFFQNKLKGIIKRIKKNFLVVTPMNVIANPRKTNSQFFIILVYC